MRASTRLQQWLAHSLLHSRGHDLTSHISSCHAMVCMCVQDIFVADQEFLSLRRWARRRAPTYAAPARTPTRRPARAASCICWLLSCRLRSGPARPPCSCSAGRRWRRRRAALRTLTLTLGEVRPGRRPSGRPAPRWRRWGRCCACWRARATLAGSPAARDPRRQVRLHRGCLTCRQQRS